MSAQSFTVGSIRIFPTPRGVTLRFPCNCSVQTITNPSCVVSPALLANPLGVVDLDEGSNGHTGSKDLVSNQARVGPMIPQASTAPGFVGPVQGSYGHTRSKDLGSNQSVQARVGPMIPQASTSPGFVGPVQGSYGHTRAKDPVIDQARVGSMSPQIRHETPTLSEPFKDLVESKMKELTESFPSDKRTVVPSEKDRFDSIMKDLAGLFPSYNKSSVKLPVVSPEEEDPLVSTIKDLIDFSTPDKHRSECSEQDLIQFPESDLLVSAELPATVAEFGGYPSRRVSPRRDLSGFDGEFVDALRRGGHLEGYNGGGHLGLRSGDVGDRGGYRVGLNGGGENQGWFNGGGNQGWCNGGGGHRRWCNGGGQHDGGFHRGGQYGGGFHRRGQHDGGFNRRGHHAGGSNRGRDDIRDLLL